MEIKITGTPEEIKKLLQAIESSKEQKNYYKNEIDVLKGKVHALEFYERQRTAK